MAQVIPIPKSEQLSNPTNYRPISLLSILSKLLERYVQTHLLNHFEDYSPLSAQQWGFSKGKSTTGALLSTTHAWHMALEAGEDVCCVFLDLTKAFGKVPHSPLSQTLADRGINAHLLNWLYDYLSQRSQYVVVNGERSKCSNVISGVPQGSVLGPLLFIIYLDGITKLPLHDGSCLLLYADDILLYRRIQHQEDYLLLQQDIATLELWLQQKYLQLNVAKCKYMVLTRKHHPIDPSHPLAIQGAPIERAFEFKYLGVCLTHNLSWKSHILQISKKARKQAGIIYRTFYKYSNPDCLKQLYLSFVRPHLEYATPVWDPYCSSHVDILEKVQKFALHISYKAWKEQYASLLERSGLQPLAIRRKLLKLCYLYHLIQGDVTFSEAPIIPRNLDPRLRNFHPQLLCQPYCRST